MAATLSLVAAGSFNRGEAVGSNARAADDNVSIAPLRAPSNAYAQNFVGVARIIHVPQPGERDERASINERDQAEAIDADDDAPVAPPPRRRGQPRWPPRSDAPLELVKSFVLLRRYVLNKPEGDHVREFHAMPLRGRPFAKLVAG